MEVKLPDVCQIQYGFAFDSAQFSTTAGIPLIRIRDVVRGYSETYTTEKCSDAYFVNNGDILIGMDGEFNIARWQGGQALLNQRVCRLLPNDKIDQGYLFYFMPQALKRIEEQTPFVTVKHLSAKQLNSINIPLPELGAQQRIATVLDKVSNLISLRKQQLAKLDELVKARFVEMFGDPGTNPKKWPDTPLVKCCSDPDDIKCGPFGTQLSKAEYQTTGIPLWGIPQVNSYFRKPPVDYLSKEKAQQLIVYSLIPDDIVMSRKGNVGMCAIYPDCFGPGIIHSDVLRIRVDPKRFNPYFLMCQLNISPRIENQINVVSSGAIMAGINVSKLKDILVHEPPVELQNKFAEFYKKIDSQKLTIQQSLDKLEVLKKALMQEYFG